MSDQLGVKDVVLQEAYRVLKKGGKFAALDIVLRKPLPEEVKKNMEMWTGCIAGALLDKEYITKLKRAGFTDPFIEELKIYKIPMYLASCFVN